MALTARCTQPTSRNGRLSHHRSGGKEDAVDLYRHATDLDSDIYVLTRRTLRWGTLDREVLLFDTAAAISWRRMPSRGGDREPSARPRLHRYAVYAAVGVRRVSWRLHRGGIATTFASPTAGSHRAGTNGYLYHVTSLSCQRDVFSLSASCDAALTIDAAFLSRGLAEQQTRPGPQTETAALRWRASHHRQRESGTVRLAPVFQSQRGRTKTVIVARLVIAIGIKALNTRRSARLLATSLPAGWRASTIRIPFRHRNTDDHQHAHQRRNGKP